MTFKLKLADAFYSAIIFLRYSRLYFKDQCAGRPANENSNLWLKWAEEEKNKMLKNNILESDKKLAEAKDSEDVGFV